MEGGVKMSNQMSIPAGIDDFREAREKSQYYIDKTLMIQDFLSYQDYVSLITRPRRFGKTMNMTMMRDFFDISQKSEDIFSGLAIMETEYASQLNSRPVIFLSFKGCSGANLEELKVSLAFAIKDEFIKFEKIMIDSKKVDLESNDYYEFYHLCKTFNWLVAKEEKDIRIADITIKRSLLVLTRVLRIFYDQKPLVLIDDYDQPIINATINGFLKAFSSNVYANFLGEALKGNNCIHQALLTGVQPVIDDSFNNLSFHTVADDEYANCFGFTVDETERALADHGMILNEEVKSFYDGYCIGGYDIYNPWSIHKYLAVGNLAPYWADASISAPIGRIILTANHEFQEDFEELIRDGEIESFARLKTSFYDLETPSIILWDLLVNFGYLTIESALGGGDYIVRIPNQEVKMELRKFLIIL